MNENEYIVEVDYESVGRTRNGIKIFRDKYKAIQYYKDTISSFRNVEVEESINVDCIAVRDDLAIVATLTRNNMRVAFVRLFSVEVIE